MNKVTTGLLSSLMFFLCYQTQAQTTLTIVPNDSISISSGSVSNAASVYEWGASGSSSQEALPRFEDGYVEITAQEITTLKMFGLSQTDVNNHWNTIDYAMYLTNQGKIVIMENGSQVYANAADSYAVGDLLQVKREGAIIKYIHIDVSNSNFEKLIYTSSVPSLTELYFDFALKKKLKLHCQSGPRAYPFDFGRYRVRHLTCHEDPKTKKKGIHTAISIIFSFFS